MTPKKIPRPWIQPRHEVLGLGSRGQSLVETALVLPIFLLILFGLVDVGRLVYTNSMTSQAAREGARLASVQARWIGATTADDVGCVASAAAITSLNPGAHVCPADVATMRANIQAAANSELVAAGQIAVTNVYVRCDAADATAPTGAWTGASCTSSDIGDQVSVRVVLTYVPLTPIVGPMLGSIVLSGSATMAIN